MGHYGRLSVKLKALIACGENSITEVARVFKVSRYTLNEWIKTLKNGEVADLEIKQGRGRSAIVSEAHYAEIKSWLITNPQLSTDAVQEMINKRIGISIGRTATYNLIKKLNLSYITPRPSHYKGNKEAQESFKKTSKMK